MSTTVIAELELISPDQMTVAPVAHSRVILEFDGRSFALSTAQVRRAAKSLRLGGCYFEDLFADVYVTCTRIVGGQVAYRLIEAADFADRCAR